MQYARQIVPAGQWRIDEQRDLVRLTFDDRFRRRWRFTGIGGLIFLLDLSEARLLNHGDGLQLDSGGFVAVEALPEPLLEVAMPEPAALARIAWHLGNRHLPVQLGANKDNGGWLRLRADHVIEDLLTKLGATPRRIAAPFTPEGGGYGNAVPPASHHDHDDPLALEVASATLASAALYRVMTWLSSAYPIGAFSYSHGIEYAVEAGLVRDRVSLIEWVTTILRDGSAKLDGALLAAAWRAAKADDSTALDDIADLANAWRGTAELALESTAQGTAFVTVTTAAWPDDRLTALAARHGGKLALPVALGVALASHVPLAEALAAYLTAFAANLVSAGVRLIPLGQTDGQLSIAALEPVVAGATSAGLTVDLDELGTAAPMLDWCSPSHETQYTRLFRS